MNLPEKLAAFDGSLPLERASTIPGTWYTDPEIAAAERAAVFGDSWLCVGRADQVAAPGDFFTINVAGEPLLVARGEDRVLRAFYNVCRHKAARVACAEAGNAPRFRCRYHGWTYDLAGALRGVPEFDGVECFTREASGLRAIAVGEQGPLVFVSMGAPRTTLAQWIEPMAQVLAPFALETLRFHERRSYDLACNWKVFVDNYLDGGYHVNTLHLSLAGVLDYKAYRTELFERSSVQSSPLKASDDEATTSVRGGREAAYFWLYPNLMINAYEGILDTNVVLPLGPDRCRVLFDFYFAAGKDETFKKESIAVSDRIQAEDVEISEDVQRGLASRAYSTGRYSAKREAGVHHFHRLLASQLRGEPHAR